MANIKRMKNDMATLENRDKADTELRDNRIRNDELTIERRFEADDIKAANRLKNDEKTASRRELKDERSGSALAIFLLILLVLAVGVLFISI